MNNAKYYGGGFQITPQANIEDGYMDICVVDKIPKAKIPYMTTIAAAKATIKGILYVQKHGNGEVKSLQQIHEEITDK